VVGRKRKKGKLGGEESCDARCDSARRKMKQRQHSLRQKHRQQEEEEDDTGNVTDEI